MERDGLLSVGADRQIELSDEGMRLAVAVMRPASERIEPSVLKILFCGSAKLARLRRPLTLPGTPATKEPGGITAPWPTTAPAATREPAPIRAPFR